MMKRKRQQPHGRRQDQLKEEKREQDRRNKQQHYRKIRGIQIPRSPLAEARLPRGKRAVQKARQGFNDWLANALVGGERAAHRHCNVEGQLPPPLAHTLVDGVWSSAPNDVMDARVARSTPFFSSLERMPSSAVLPRRSSSRTRRTTLYCESS